MSTDGVVKNIFNLYDYDTLDMYEDLTNQVVPPVPPPRPSVVSRQL